MLRPSAVEASPHAAATDDGPRLFRSAACRRDPAGVWQLPRVPGEACQVGLPSVTQNPNVRALVETRAGLLVGVESGELFELSSGTVGVVHAAGDRPGISDVIADSAGNVWTSYLTRGIARVARRGVVSYDLEPALGGARVRTILGEQSGALMLATGRLSVYRFTHDGVSRLALGLPPRVLLPPWSSELLDRRGDLWLGTGQGLFRFSPPAGNNAGAPRLSHAVYSTRDGLTTNAIGELFEDSRGDVWIGTGPGFTGASLSRWERLTGRIAHHHPALERPGHVTAFAEDPTGRVWAAFRDGGFARIATDRIEVVGGTENIVSGHLYFDRNGRLWATSLNGALRFDEPGSSRPTVRRYTTRDGLSSDLVTAFTEDSLGRLYIGTVAAVDRLDITTGQIRHYGPSDGLASGEIIDAFSASNGEVWFTTGTGLVRLTPDALTSEARAAVRIGGISIAGVPQALSELGIDAAGEFRFPVSQSRIAISFFSLSPDLIEPVRYQYQLEGLDTEWSTPTFTTTLARA